MSRALPNSQDAERSVLGAILLDSRALASVADVLEPADFYHPTHGFLYEAMLALEKDSKPIDYITIGEQLSMAGEIFRFKPLGGYDYYCTELTSSVVTVDNVRWHARIVRAKATLRKLVELTEALAKEGATESGDAEEFVGKAERAVFELAQRAQPSSYELLPSILARGIKAIEKRYDARQAVTGVPSGIPGLDSLTCGFHPGDLIIVAARPGMGKSSMGLKFLLSAALDFKIPGLFFSLEMSKESLIERALSCDGEINSQALRCGMLTSVDWRKLAAGAARLARAPIAIDDTAAPTLSEIRTKARRWRIDPAIPHGPENRGIILVDYLQLVVSDRRANTGRITREQEIAEISRGLKALAKDLEVPIVALAQLNRAVESRGDKRPQLSDLREGGSIEQDADLVAFLYRDEMYNPDTHDKGIAELIIGKQRNGPTGTVKVGFDKSSTRFYALPE